MDKRVKILNLKQYPKYTEQYLNIISDMFDSEEIYNDEHFGVTIYDEYGYDYIDWHIQEDLLKKPYFYVWVAVIKRKVVGFAAMTTKEEPVASIYNVYIIPKYRRLGIAMALKTQMVDQAQKLKCPIITSAVNRWNHSSRKMNEKAGWKMVDSHRECGTIYYYKVLNEKV